MDIKEPGSIQDQTDAIDEETKKLVTPNARAKEALIEYGVQLPEEEAEILKDRAAAYGDASITHANLGLYWTGILQQHFGIELDHPVPADVVLLMLAANKINRAVLPTSGKLDDYVDLRNYAHLGWEARKEQIYGDSKRHSSVCETGREVPRVGRRTD